MIQQRMNEWILHPESLNADTLQELRTVLERYPYYQTAWILYLKNLFLLHDETFHSEVRRGALYVADLSMLFYYIEGDKFVIQKHNDDRSPVETADRTLDLIDRFLSESPDSPQSPKDIPFSMEVNLDYASVLINAGNADTDEQPALPLKGQELIDSFIASNGSGKNPIVQDAAEDSGRLSEEAGMDTSLEDSGGGTALHEIQGGPENTGLLEEDSEASVEEDEDESYFTETLAKIYIKQQRYDKALEIIKKLNLKYPKKNIYFADQIRFLEKLIINAKSK